MPQPETRYARRPDGVSIAYQVLGTSGPPLVFVPGFMSHLDLQWTDPGFSHFLTSLSSFTRLIVFDKPGTGLSDPIPHVPTLEERIADVRSLLDTVGVDTTALLGFSEGGTTCAMFAATWPERTSAVIIYGSFAKGRPTDAELQAVGATEAYQRLIDGFSDALEHWGEGRLGALLAPSAHGEFQRRFWGIFERAGASPAMARALLEAAERADVSAILSAIQAPTLVLHRVGDVFPIAGGRLFADGIHDARFVEIPGGDHAFWAGDVEPITDEIERFLTGRVGAPEADRVLSSLLFTDIVGSTQRASRLGDDRWRDLLEKHNALVRARLEHFGGTELDIAGDGFFASFEGPARAVECACAIADGVQSLGLEVRAGVHTGECEVVGGKPAGLAVHIAARIAALAQGNEVLVSRTVRDLVIGSRLHFQDRGLQTLRGVDGTWQLFAVDRASQGVATASALDGPREHMTAADRGVVAVARRTPWLLRTFARLVR